MTEKTGQDDRGKGRKPSQTKDLSPWFWNKFRMTEKRVANPAKPKTCHPDSETRSEWQKKGSERQKKPSQT